MPAAAAPSPLAARVLATGLLPHGCRVLAACSGGADSVGLVLLLDELRSLGRLDVAVAHVHHGLRADAADADLALVQALAARLGLPLSVVRGDAAELARRRRRGLEEAARTLRRQSLEKLRQETGCELVALAHTRDDQAETLLLRLLRGAGAPGLSGMRALTAAWVRPLLHLGRGELHAHVRDAGMAWRSDPTNWDLSARALLRPLLPRLDAVLGGDAATGIARAAALLAEESDYLDALAQQASRGLLEPPASPGLEAPRASLRAGPAGLGALDRVVARRLLRQVVRSLRPDDPPPSADAVERLLDMATAARPAREAHVAGLVARRSADRLLLGAAPVRAVPTAPVDVAIPGRTAWGSHGVVIARVECAPADPLAAIARGPDVAVLDLDMAGPLALRARDPGDRFRPVGAPAARRLGRWLRERGLAREERDLLPVACRADARAIILWVPGQSIAHECRVTPATRRLLLLEWRPGSRD